MRCLNCHYDLSNLTEHRCPECGNAFDPNDPSTFEHPGAIQESRKRTDLRVLIGVWVAAAGTVPIALLLGVDYGDLLMGALAVIGVAWAISRMLNARREQRLPKE